MPVIDTATADGLGLDGRIRPSEDRIIIVDRAVVLLDGATAVLPEQPSGGWYADVLGSLLRERLLTTPHEELVTVLEGAIAHARDEHHLHAGLGPCSTVAIVRWSDTEVEALVLADSPVAVQTVDDVHVLSDDRLANLPRGGGGYRARLRDGSGYDDGHLAALQAGVRSTARWRNVEGGYWVAEADPAAARRARTRRWPREQVRSVILASDGVSCGVDDYGLFDWSDMFNLAESEGAKAVLDAVRAAEQTDPDGRRWPRPKMSDDQALAHLRFG